MAREVNFCWNYINDLSHKHTQRTGKFFSSYEIQKYTAGATKEGLTILSNSICGIADEYVARRFKARKARLRWRISKGARRSLGWIPFKKGDLYYRNGQLRYNGRFFGMWDSYGLSDYELRSGSFSQDARGRWYANICVEPKRKQSVGTSAIGIDLGLKDFATLSNGEKVEAQRIYRNAEKDLAAAQRARKASRVKAIHAKIKNRRADFLHKLSTRLVSENGAIFVGKVNASALAQTVLAKSVLDAGWSAFRTMLKYKCDHAGVLFKEVNEAFSTQTCSSCGALPETRPKGIAGLGIREWTCTECGAHHDRDVNAARNILRLGHETLVAGAPDQSSGGGVNLLAHP